MLHLRRTAPLGVATIAVLVPLVANDFWLLLLDQALVLAIAATGLFVLAGLSGQLSVAQGAFVAVGGYVAGVTAVEWQVTLIPAVLVAVVVAVVLSVAVGAPALRMGHLYLAIATLAFHVALLFLLRELEITGKSTGLRLPVSTIGPWHVESRVDFFYLLLFLASAGFAIAKRIEVSRTGRALAAVRDSATASAAMGVAVARYRLLAFAIAGAYGAVAGAVGAHLVRSITPDTYPLLLSIQLLTFVIVGGATSVGGVVAAAVVLSLVPEGLRIAATNVESYFPAFADQLLIVQSGVFGLVLVAVLVYEPTGLAGWWAKRCPSRFRPPSSSQTPLSPDGGETHA